jgi:hypothetical protein
MTRSVKTWYSSSAPQKIRGLNTQTLVWELPRPHVHVQTIPDSTFKAHQGVAAFHEEGVRCICSCNESMFFFWHSC